jgi:hypothetical protein
VVSWTALTTTAETGDSAITEYNLYWDSGTGTVTTSLYAGTGTTYTVTGLSAGTNYIFKVRAKNIYGYGSFSSDVTFTTSTTVPGTMSELTTAYNPHPIIDISWTAPSNGGAAID